MNRKQRNNRFRFYEANCCNPLVYSTSFYNLRLKARNRVNRNRKAAKLRRLYHHRADWICPTWKRNRDACDRCKHEKRCKAMLPF